MKIFLFVLIYLSLTTTSYANNNRCDFGTVRCSDKHLPQTSIDKAIFLADDVAVNLKQIEDSEAKAGRTFEVAIIGRMGTDLEKLKVFKDFDAQGNPRDMDHLLRDLASVHHEHLDPKKITANLDTTQTVRYSHMGFAFKNAPGADSSAGEWTIINLLYTCDDNKSHIFQQGLGDFFADDMKKYRAQIIVPSVEIQQRIQAILVDQPIRDAWINHNYNALAKFGAADEQNSNSFIIEVLGAAQKPFGQITNRTQAIEILTKTNYMSTKVQASGLFELMTLPGISHFLPTTICLKEQSKATGHGVAEVISALSIENYLRRQNEISLIREVELP